MPEPQTPKKPEINPEHQRVLTALTTRLTQLGLSVMPRPEVTDGVMVSLYRFRPNGRTKVSTIAAQAEELALTLCVESVYVQALPHEGSVGIYVPRPEAKPLKWLNLLAAATQQPSFSTARLPLVLGSDWLGRVQIDDLATIPHMLNAGSTGSGKSIWLRSQFASIVCLLNNNDVKIVLSDTKQVEFQDFIGCPALLFGEIATKIGSTVDQMRELVKLTDDRLRMIASAGTRNIHEYNQSVVRGAIAKMPYVVMGIDELADIAEDSEGMDVLDYITRKSRAAGIHVIASTQRPSADVVKGLIKNNLMGRVCFRMPDGINSRIVLGENGAENLLKQGDFLYSSPNFNGLQRLHSGYATSNDIKASLEMAVYSQQLGMGNEWRKPIQ